MLKLKKCEQAQVKKEEIKRGSFKKKKAFENWLSYPPSLTQEQKLQVPHQSSSTPLQRPKIILKKQSTEIPFAKEQPKNDVEITA
ncbi:hypothetical protein L1987_03959 [Smallanthus sonchifolius]|uniref:Uncharacterized protein n=1 Tax=Smallanthus sonchifolius TaxID=185202 RepID=A0ACB9KBZ4_9ASTR|nr:hypothetical protein L1987_03959 [Smallanthus sonchifolius]